MRRCQGNDYMLSSARGGWNIYILDNARLTTETATMLPGDITSGQDGIGWIPIAVPIICVCVLIPVVVVAVVFVRKKKVRNAEETVTYVNTVQAVATAQSAESEMETPKTYYGLKSRDQPEPSEYESIQAPTYEQLE